MTKHSTIIGGSTADRLLNCPGSFQQLQLMPEQIEVPSEYANYGSAMHAVMDKLAVLYAGGFSAPKEMVRQTASELLGETFYDRVLEQHHLTDSIFPAIDTLYELMSEYGGGFTVVANELRVKFPGVPGAFGTSDLLISNKKFVVLIDWKFGQGIPVKAVYREPEGDRVNPQILYYFAGAMAELPKVFEKKRYAVAIIQPRTEEKLTHTIITRAEVEYFIEDVERAIMLALGKNPPLQVGDHCRWCPARPHCPEHTKPLFALSDLGLTAPALQASVSDDGSYGEFLSKAKYLADLVAPYVKQVNEQVHTYLENGGTVPGWRLKQKQKLRQWVDEQEVSNTLYQLGFQKDEIWQTKLQTFAVAEKAAKRLKVKIPEHLRVAPPSDETVVVPSDDPSPVIDRAEATKEFAAALKQLRHEQ